MWQGFLPKNSIVMAKVREIAAEAKSEVHELKQIANDLEGCARCKLSNSRKNILKGDGTENAKIMFVAEAPTDEEDLQARSWVGPAGVLLEKLLNEANLSKDQVFYTHLVKCKTPGGRMPENDELSACHEFFKRQLKALSPKVVVALGKFSAQTLLETDAPINELRENFHAFEGHKLLPTFHPAYLLKSVASQSEACTDFKKVAQEVG